MTATDGKAQASIDPRRYRRLVAFFFRVLLHALVWDLLLNLPILRRLRRPALPRWVGIARRFRFLAVELGGVMIKLGQFLSTRADLIPREITEELSGLQDEVPAAKFDEIVAQIGDDFGRPASEVFPVLAPEPSGAASLAQVHEAELADGSAVVVKVLRPGIDSLVETDLAALRWAIRWLGLWRKLRRRVDVERLIDEFDRTTRRELDLVAEGHHAERFAELFADDAGVVIPKVFWDQTRRRTLTLENVAGIKIDDFDGLEAAGLERRQVARRLFETYLRQIFDFHFVHADPHPGNLFVLPGPGEPGEDRELRIAFVDFGMVASIPERLQKAVREFAVGIGTRDAYRIVQAYQWAGVLLPGADLKRIEDAHEVLLDRFWGVEVGSLRDVALAQMGELLGEFRDLLFEMPFQLQVDLVFVDRALGILLGLTTQLAPELDLWSVIRPFAERLARETRSLGRKGLLREVAEQLRIGVELPRSLDQLVRQMRRGNLTVRSTLGSDMRRAFLHLERAVVRLTWIVLGAGFLISGTLLDGAGQRLAVGTGLVVLSGICLLAGLFSARRR